MPERLKNHIERSRNNPYEWAFCIALLFLSVYGMVWAPPSASLDEGLSSWMRYAYSGVGLIGAVFTIVGLRVRDEHAVLLAERIGQVGVAGGALTFFVVLCHVSTFAESGLVTGCSLAIFAGAAGRAGQITRDLSRERRLMTAALGIQDALQRLPEDHRPEEQA